MDNGYFHLQLHAFLASHHPDKLLLLSHEELGAFIDLRAEGASEAFEQSRRAGSNVIIASEAANSVLFAGLEFSPYELIKDIIEECYPSYLPLLEDSQDRSFTKKLLSHFIPLISTLYDEEGNPRTEWARYELVGELSLYLKKIFI